MIKTVYFDLGNVLVFFSLPKLFSQVSRCTGLTPEEVARFFFDTDLRELYEKGLIDTEQLYRMFLNHSPTPFSLHEFTSAFSDIFTPNTELWEVVEQLKNAGIRLILLSNTSECHFNYAYSHYPILHLFDHRILSFEAGVWKPDPQIFQKALGISQCKREECFYTDDVPEFIANARKVGLQGEIFTNVPKLKQQLVNYGLEII